MDERQDSALYKRVEQLEIVVEDLRHTISQLAAALAENGIQVPAAAREASSALKTPSAAVPESTPEPVPQPAPASPASPAPARISRLHFDVMWNSEYWLNKLGIGLLLFGLAFLFKYSIDQGWATPLVRIGIGLALGIALLVIGLRIHKDRRHFSQVLLGGSLATFYITGFAAFQFYALLSYPIAFAFMVFVTLLAFFLSVRQNEAVLSLIGTAGGLGTPFLLYTDAGSLAGLVGYTCLVLGGTSAIYMARGWRSLLWTSFIGGWAVLLIGYSSEVLGSLQPASSDRWALQLGIIFGWLAFWALPMIREVLATRNPIGWPQPSLDFLAALKDLRKLIDLQVHLLSVFTPLIALALSMQIWPLADPSWGWITIGGAIVYALAAWSLWRWGAEGRLAYTQALVAVLLLTIALVLLLDGDALFLALAAEAMVLHIAGHRLPDRGTALGAHLLFLVVGLWLAARLSDRTVETAIFSIPALVDLAVIALVLGASTVLRSREATWLYRIGAHIAFLSWLVRELAVLPNGQAYITIAWGMYAVALLVLALRRDLSLLRTIAMGTLLLVVAKLFLIDLAELEAIWRILLFLGFGTLFLALSYYFPVLWKPASKPTDTSG